MIVAVADVRSRELGAYLRARRDRLSPADVGLPGGGGRRRVKGLRREEVAALANVGSSWYTWLEQGRDVQPSVEVLAAIADALRLSSGERRHLFLLGGHSDAEQPSSGERASSWLQALLDSLSPHPAAEPGRVKRIRSLHVGSLSVRAFTMLLEENPRTRVVVYQPADRTTQERLEELANRIARGTIDGPASVRQLRPAT